MSKIKLNLQQKLPDLLGQIEVLKTDIDRCSNSAYSLNGLIIAIYSLVNRGGLLDQFSLKSQLRFRKIKTQNGVKSEFIFGGSKYISVRIENKGTGQSVNGFNPNFDGLFKLFESDIIDVSEWWGKEKFWISRGGELNYTRFKIMQEIRNSLGAHPESVEINDEIYSIMFKNVMQIKSLDNGASFNLQDDTILSSSDVPPEIQRSLLNALVLQIGFELKVAIINSSIEDKLRK
jgi:hypothetical protein